ncbi:tetratricopeptide repeat protein, partial [Pleurocapsales cyanobacterium LEGE 10410]|nr:tetratricopeptide repeat protein [Pleurocapsales cyanobacterium LEGE 10410]
FEEITNQSEEPELSEPKFAPVAETKAADSHSSAVASIAEFADKPATILSSTTEEPSNLESTSNDDLSAIAPPNEQDPVAVDLQQIINLIQDDEELAQQILQKLNVSSAQPNQNLEVSQSSVVPTHSLEQSDLELIESWFNLGLKQVSAGNFAAAIASWEQALNINPNLSEAWHNRGSALGRLGKYEEAVTSFQNALTIDPNNYQAWNDRAHALYQLQNWTEAVNSWNNAIKIMPGNHLFWYNRGCALEQLANWSEAIVSYEKSLEIKPDFPPGRSRYINLVADNSRSN